MNILFENEKYWIVCKPAGMLSEQNGGQGLADLLAAQNGGYAGVIHRLDREVGGLMVYAKTPAAAAWLSEAAQNHRLEKEYYAAVVGNLQPDTGEWHDFLFYDRAKNKVFPVKRSRRGVKEAILQYRVERVVEWEGIGTVSFAAIRPLTGRTHQIRVQFSSRGHAVLGDRRYGAPPLPGKFEKGAIMLACRKITIPEKEKPAVFYWEPEWDPAK